MKIKIRVPSTSPCPYHNGEEVEVEVYAVTFPDGTNYTLSEGDILPADDEEKGVVGGLPKLLGQELKNITVEFK